MTKKTQYSRFLATLLVLAISLIASVSAIVLPSTNAVYLEVNRTYPLYLIPLDNNVWNITMWVQDINWTPFNFTWTGSQYQLNLMFTSIKDYPFVINSTEVSGDIRGTFLVRRSYNVTFKFLKDKASTIFSSNKYINEMAYVTAEFTGTKTFFGNNYNPTLEPFIQPLSDSRFKKPVFYARYTNGEATLKLYDTGEYAIRLIDGNIYFPNEYSVPNISRSYGTNVYIGKYTFNGNSSTNTLLLTQKDLHPFSWLANWVLIIIIIMTVIISIFLFFLIPDKPSIALILSMIIIIGSLVARVILWFYTGQ